MSETRLAARQHGFLENLAFQLKKDNMTKQII